MIPVTFEGEELHTSPDLLGYAATATGIGVSRWKHGRGGLGEEWHRIGMNANKEGYHNISIRIRGQPRTWAGIHFLVCWIFHGPRPDPGPKNIRWGALHENGDPSDNTPGNLYWGDLDDANIADREKHGRTARGTRQGGAKLDDDIVREIRSLALTGVPATEIAARIRIVCVWTIREVINRRLWKHVT